MQPRNSGRVHEQMLRQLERNEKKEAFQRDRFMRFKLFEIYKKLTQILLMDKVIETDNPAAMEASLLKGFKQAISATPFDFDYFIAPMRGLVPRANPYSLYITQYILEVMMEEPCVLEVYGTEEEIYHIVNRVVSAVNIKFERTEEELIRQMNKNKSVQPGTREYDIALDQLARQTFGEPIR